MSVPNFRKPNTLVRHINRTGGYFFSPGAMQFFNSVTEPDYMRRLTDDENGNPRYLVIVSNQFESDPREYAIVLCKPRDGAGSSADYATDDRFETSEQARIHADRIAAGMA